jgi:hypothetical protein
MYTMAAFLLLLAIFLCSPLFPFVRSLAVMGIYSNIHGRQSLMTSTGMKLHIPGGLTTLRADWYPFTMTFVADDAYSAYIGEEGAKLTILYNFPSFSYTKGCSRLFDATSRFYTGFYGAYLVRDSSNVLLASGIFSEEKVAQIAKFDFFGLVLSDFGITPEESVFEFSVTEKERDISYAGYEGWIRITADITVNGGSHNKRRDVMSYLQYGSPGFGEVEEEFLPVSMTGVVYGRYFPECDAGIYFYIMGEEGVCRECDDEILSRSTISFL